MPETDEQEVDEKATWSTAYINDLPDSAFLYIEPGGEKDENGRTVPRSLRHLPVRDAEGNVDLPHVRNALSRLGQSATGEGWLSESLRARLTAQAERLLAQQEKSASKASEDLLISWGGEVKMQADGAVSGYLVRFTDPDNPDLEGEYFDKATDFAIVEGQRSPIYYHHGQDPIMGKRVIGQGTLVPDDVGIWLEGQIEQRDKWEKAVRQLGLAHKLGWSSGTAGHLVEREPGPKATRIKRWPLGLDASLTPSPAEPGNFADLKTLRAQAVPSLKALVPDATSQGSAGKSAAKAVGAHQTRSERRDKTMLKTYASGGRYHVFAVGEEGEPSGLPVKTFDKQEEAEAYIEEQGKPEMLRIVEAMNASQEKTLTTLVSRLDAMQQAMIAQPRRSGVLTTPSSAEPAQVNGKTFSDWLYAVMENDTATLKAMGTERYASSTKVLGEQTGPAGAFLVPEQFIPELIRIEPESEIVYPRADRQTVRGPIALPGLSTAGQTQGVTNFLGGVRAYWTESGEYKSATEPEFTEIKLHPWELSGYCPVKDQLLDRSAINLPNLLSQLFREALMFYRDEAFLDGTGAGQPLGIINAPGTYIQARQTAGTITYLDLVNMKGHLLPSSWMTAHWIFSISDYPTLRTLQDPEGHYIWGADAVGGEPRTILGLPYVFTEKTPALGNQGDVILADERHYYVAEEGGIAIASSEHVQFLQNRTVFKFYLKVDGQEKLAAPIYLKDGVTQVSPFVILGGAATT